MDKPHHFTLRYSLSNLLSFSCLWSYGLYAYLQIPNTHLSLIVTAFLALLTGSTVVFAKYFPQEIIIHFDRNFLFAVLGFTIFFFCLQYSNLIFSLNGDELYHAQYSQVLGQKIIRLLAIKKGFFLDKNFKYLLWGFNFSLLAAGALFFILVKKTKLTHQIFILSCLCLFLRLAILSAGGNADIHPPLRLFPLWLGSAIFAGSNFSFHLPQLLSLILFCGFIFQSTQKVLGHKNSFLFGIFLGTLPIIIDNSFIVEPSLWNFIAWTICFFTVSKALETDNFKERKSYWLFAASVLCLGTMMRQPSFIGYIPLFLIMIIRERKNILSCIPCLYPTLLMLPQTVGAIILKTPGSKDINSHSAFHGAIEAITRGIAPIAIVNSVFPYGVILLALSFVPFSKKDFSTKIILLFWFVLAFFLFYSIGKDLWGIQRYQVEYIAPFIVYGLYTAIKKIQKAGIISAILLAIIFTNLFNYFSLPRINASADARKTMPQYLSKVYTESYYDIGIAYEDIKAMHLAGSTYFAGIGYGNYSNIIHNYSVKEWIDEFEILNNVLNSRKQRGAEGLSYANSADIVSNPKIKAVIWADCIEEEGADTFLKNLQRGGFKLLKVYYNEKYGSTIRLLVRA